MGTAPLPEATLREAVAAMMAARGNSLAAARALGISTTKVEHRIRAALRLGLLKSRDELRMGPVDPPPAPLALPEFSDDSLPAEQILDHLEKSYRRAHSAAAERKWFRIRIGDDLPTGIAWFGDPHLGARGCNIPLLRRDAQIVRDTPGLYGANMGDTVDNWGGRLIRLYAENDVSRKTERALARWFLRDSGVKWLLWLHGNHEHMDREFQTYMDTIGAPLVPMIDWRAQFVLGFPGGAEFRIDAAHNHKGHSMWNELHGQERAAYMEEPAELYIAGDHHCWAYKVKELADARVVTLVRVRGYKFVDGHARRWQFPEQQHGAAVVTVFNPQAREATKRLRVFADVSEGAEYLTWLRSKAGRAERAAPKARKR